MNVDEAMNALVGTANQYYTAMLRFHLFDKERRTFVAEGFCFLAAIDDWVSLGGFDDLKTIRYIKLLRAEEFFDSSYF
jgi:hypothetical protein